MLGIIQFHFSGNYGDRHIESVLKDDDGELLALARADRSLEHVAEVAAEKSSAH